MSTNIGNDEEVLALKGRVWESDLLDWRGYRMTALLDWKKRLRMVDAVARGDWAEVFSDESIMLENPHVMNLVQVGMNDKAKLASESVPSVVCYPEKETTTETEKAHLREAAFDTHWEMNNGDIMVPQLSMDLDGAGAAFVAVYVDKNTSDYPIYHRIDPRNAYPDIINGHLLDLIVLEDVNYRIAARAWPQLNLDQDPTIKNKYVELLHYYSPDECIQAVILRQDKNAEANECYIVNRWDPMGVLPVAFAKLDSFDGHFRGNYDQVTGSLQTKNRIVKQILDYMDEVVYAPKEELGVLNPDAMDGPGTTYHLDPMVPGAHISRIPAAAGALNAIPVLIEFLTQEQRGGTSYPAARQGEVSQSIASASFVASTMGSLTSDVRNIQRLIGKIREQLNMISGHYDENFLDFQKPLIRPISRVISYTPSRTFSGNYKSRVIYGASAGLDRMTADTRVMQHVGNGLVSRATGREQIDYVRDPNAEEAKIELEQTVDILKQKLLSTADMPTMLRLVELQAEGLNLQEAAAKVSQEQQAQAQVQPAEAGGPPGTPGPEGAPVSAPQEAQAMQAGGPAPPPQFAPPPLEQIMVGRQPGGAVTKL